MRAELATYRPRYVGLSTQGSFGANRVRGFQAAGGEKKYDTFVDGEWPPSVRTVSLRLQRYETAWGERGRVSSSGQLARTDFSVIARKAQATHLAATLHTGRTHQIRVHTQSQQHPIWVIANMADRWACGAATLFACVAAGSPNRVGSTECKGASALTVFGTL